ncbi:hypothetical protein EDD17DRAFT_206062 [Pisolithus thermaeus]|nr:hypothetical protein EDD17DRAFT_206062 [Pisolithus thermaeus]
MLFASEMRRLEHRQAIRSRPTPGSSNNTVRAWDVKTGAQVGNALRWHTTLVNAVSVSSDRGCISSDSGLVLWRHNPDLEGEGRLVFWGFPRVCRVVRAGHSLFELHHLTPGRCASQDKRHAFSFGLGWEEAQRAR